jgi:hypothetical protein
MNTQKFKPMRFCKKCNQDLPKTLEYFTPRKTDKEGFNLYCKECINKEKRQKRKEKRQLWDKGGKVEEGEGRRCTICKNIYPSTEDFFGKHLKSASGLDTYCKPCRRDRNIKNYNKSKNKWNQTHSKTTLWKKEQIIKHKQESKGCSKCKEKRHYLLDFHHMDPSTKLFQIGQGEAKGWEKIKKEIDKCVILCSNCHRDFHYQEKNFNITIKEYLKDVGI